MAEDIEKINEIFRNEDERSGVHEAEAPQPDAAAEEEPVADTEEKKKRSRRGLDKLLIDRSGSEAHNYTGDAESERDYRPIRQSHEYKSGCLGGVMYFVFIVCVSIVLACLLWMAASDALALNNNNFSATVVLPSNIFESETVDVFDDDGVKTGTKRITHADIDYIANELKSAGLIEYTWLFRFFCGISHADVKFDPGEYVLKSSYDYRALVQKMQTGSDVAVTVSVVIPEGFTMHQIFQRLEEKGVCSYDDLMEAAANATYNYSFLEGTEPGDASRLEGFLFPDTYEFYMNMQASSAINKFLQRFNSVLTADMEKQAQDRDMSIREILAVASLVEKEAAVDPDREVDERSLIASVIYNRLYSGMALGLESSILYEHPDHEGAPTVEMIETDTPYNLNINTGLPPTPICNPGLATIEAALNPDYSDKYYFTLDTETGTHRFFANYYDFLNFVSTQDYG